MNLEQTQESIVPEQSVIDSWPTKVRTTSNACQEQEPVEVIFDAERWLYERKKAYPMVDCLPGPADGMWKTFRFHPVYCCVVLKDQDVLVLNPNGSYSVKPKMTDQEKYLHTALASIKQVP